MPDSVQRSFSAHYLFLLSRTEYCSSVVFMRDDLTRRGCRMRDFDQVQIITPSQCWCVFGKVENPDETYPAIEFVKPDTKHERCSNVLVLADCAGGGFIR